MKKFGVHNRYYIDKELYKALKTIRYDTDAIIALLAKENMDIISELSNKKFTERQKLDNDFERYCITQSGLDFMYAYEAHKDKKRTNRYLFWIALPACIYSIIQILEFACKIYRLHSMSK